MKIQILQKILLFLFNFIGYSINTTYLFVQGLEKSLKSLFNTYYVTKKIIQVNTVHLTKVSYGFLLTIIILLSPFFLPYLSEGIAKNPVSTKKVVATNNPKSRELKEIEEKSQYLKRKIAETRAKENLAIGKLTQIQSKLSSTQSKLRDNKFKLYQTQNDLANTENRLVNLKSSYSNLQEEAEKRIRQIYQGQRLRVLEVLLKTPSLTDFLDTLYYQKLLVYQDRNLLDDISNQSKQIEDYKDRLAQKKVHIASIVNDIEKQKMQIAREHSLQQDLVRRLRTERGTYEQAERQLERESQQLIAEINRLVGHEGFSRETNLPGTGVFAYPLRGRLTSPFGMRRHPIFKVVSFHSGVDLAAPLGTPIKASDSGRVIFTGWYGGYGKVVIVDHGKDFSTLYAHLSSTATSAGKAVNQGQIIGYEGKTGYSTGPHLHFEVRKSGRPQNPLHYLR